MIPSFFSRVIGFLVVIPLFSLGLATTELSAQVSSKTRVGNLVYIVEGTSLLRYNLSTGSWLSSITLSETPTAIYPDSGYIYVAYGRGLFRRNLDGSNETALFNTPNTINGILTDADFIFVMAPSSSSSYIYSLRKSDEQMAASWNTYYSLSYAYSIDPVNKKIYGIDGFDTSFATVEIGYDSQGNLAQSASVWANEGSFLAQGRMFVRPDHAYLLRQNDNHAYSIPGLGSSKACGGSYVDAAFDSSSNTYLLRSKSIYVYNLSFAEVGMFTLTSDFQGIEIFGSTAFLFAEGSGGTVSVNTLDVSTVPVVDPGTPVDPTKINYLPDNIIAGSGDTFYFLSKDNVSLFAWNGASKSYTGSYLLRAAPTAVAYSPNLNRLYTGYSSGSIYQIKLDESATTETSFANLARSVRGLQYAGNLIFAGDQSGAWFTHYLFDASGNQLASREWNYYSTEYFWNTSNNRMYFYRDDMSPNDVLYEAIDTTTGALSNPIDSPYHGDYSISHPLRLSTDGTDVFTAAGIVYKASDLTYKASISNAVTDATYANGKLISIRLAGTATQMQEWTSNYLLKKSLSMPGAPFRVLPLSNGNVVVLTVLNSSLIFNFVDLSTYTVASSPGITTDLVDVAAFVGHEATLTVVATGKDLTYQWYKNGVEIPGATSSTLVLTDIVELDQGSYQVKVTNSLGSVVTRVAHVSVSYPPSRLVNLSTRMDVGTGNATPIVGFAISGPNPKTVLIRASGPGLAPFMPSGTLGDPTVTLYNASSASIASNDNWDSALASDFTAVGAFPWTPGSKDAALKVTLAPGNYTAVVSGPTGDAGIALVEIYEEDADSNFETRLINLSTRLMVHNSSGPAIAGFAVRGTQTKKLLIRGIGPTLVYFGVGGILANPQLSLTKFDGTPIVSNDDWGYSSGLESLFNQVGAFSLFSQNEAAMGVELEPGNYTVQLSDVGGGDGTAIIEFYEIP